MLEALSPSHSREQFPTQPPPAALALPDCTPTGAVTSMDAIELEALIPVGRGTDAAPANSVSGPGVAVPPKKKKACFGCF